MSASISPFETCDMILNHVRSSCLNFAVQETPFSVYLTLRKSFSRSPRIFSTSDQTSSLIASSPLGTDILETELETLRKEFKLLKLKNDNLERSNDELSRQVEEEVILSGHLKSELTMKTENLQVMHEKFENLESKFKHSKSENKKLDENYLKSCGAVKSLKSEKDDLKKETNKISIALATAKKETKESIYKYEKLIKKLEDNIEELAAFKVSKTAEEKALQNKQKKLERKQRNKLNPNIKSLEQDHSQSSDSYSCSLDPNDNEFENSPNDKTDLKVETTLPTDNFFSCLENLEAEPLVESATPPDFQPSGNAPLMDTTCSLKTISLNPTNNNLLATNSLNTTTTRLVASSSLDIPFNQASTNYDEERDMLNAIMNIMEDMIKKCDAIEKK